MIFPVKKPINLSSPSTIAGPLVGVGGDHVVDRRRQRVGPHGLEAHLLGMAAGSPPPLSSSAASTALDWVADSCPPLSSASSDANEPGVEVPARPRPGRPPRWRPEPARARPARRPRTAAVTSASRPRSTTALIWSTSAAVGVAPERSGQRRPAGQRASARASCAPPLATPCRVPAAPGPARGSSGSRWPLPSSAAPRCGRRTRPSAASPGRPRRRPRSGRSAASPRSRSPAPANGSSSGS